jgi:hypothetical protein
MASEKAKTAEEVFQLLDEVQQLQWKINSLKEKKKEIIDPLLDFIYHHLKSGQELNPLEAFDYFSLN